MNSYEQIENSNSAMKRVRGVEAETLYSGTNY